MNLSKNFTLEELTFSATARIRKIDNTPTGPALENLSRLCNSLLQPIRDSLQLPIIVSSSYRSPSLNKAVGGAKNSQHLYGEAADIVCSDNQKLWNTICGLILKGEITVGQLIDEKDLKWIHISLPTPSHHNQILHIK